MVKTIVEGVAVVRGGIVQADDRQNVMVVSVRLSKRDVARIQALAEQYGVGVSTYIRILVRDHLERKVDPEGPFAGKPLVEVAATQEG